MGFSIFHSGATWEKSTSKQVARTDVEEESDVNEVARGLLRRGRKINGVIEGFEDENEIEQGVTAPRSGKKRSGR